MQSVHTQIQQRLFAYLLKLRCLKLQIPRELLVTAAIAYLQGLLPNSVHASHGGKYDTVSSV